MKAIAADVWYPDAPIVSVAQADLDRILDIDATPRKRARLCLHPDARHNLHEQLICHGRETYVRPHRQLIGKSESLHMVSGELDLILFHEDGVILDVLHMGDYASGQTFYYRVNEPFYHMQIMRSEKAVFLETGHGPFVKGDTEFAPWAPAEGSPDVADFLADVESQMLLNA